MREGMPSQQAAAVRARLNRLPPSRYMWKLVLLLSLGGYFEYYDLFLTAYIGPEARTAAAFFSSTSGSFFAIAGLASFVSSTFIGLFLGTMIFSFTADRLGRRFIFTGSLLWYTLATAIMAFQNSPAGIDFWRMVAGIGIGVEIVTIDAYIAELVAEPHAGPRIRP